MDNKFYFAKEKETGNLYVGVKGSTGFSKLKNLKQSISYKFKYGMGSGVSCEGYDFYCVDIDTMEVTKYEQ